MDMKQAKQAAKVTFVREGAEGDGSGTWDVFQAGVNVGTIFKETSWCGDGYRAGGYSVMIQVPGSDEPFEADFTCSNAWGRGDYETARKAMAAAKESCRKALPGPEAWLDKVQARAILVDAGGVRWTLEVHGEVVGSIVKSEGSMGARYRVTVGAETGVFLESVHGTAMAAFAEAVKYGKATAVIGRWS